MEDEKWNENVEKCSDCGIEWKKIGKSCPVCFSPPEVKKEIMEDELIQTIMRTLAQAYCLPQHSHKEMDSQLCIDQAEAIHNMMRGER